MAGSVRYPSCSVHCCREQSAFIQKNKCAFNQLFLFWGFLIKVPLEESLPYHTTCFEPFLYCPLQRPLIDDQGSELTAYPEHFFSRAASPILTDIFEAPSAVRPTSFLMLMV